MDQGVATSHATISIDQLPVGITLPTAICDARNPRVLLLRAGTTLTESALNRLRDRGVTRVAVDANFLDRVTGGNKPASGAARSSVRKSRDSSSESTLRADPAHPSLTGPRGFNRRPSTDVSAATLTEHRAAREEHSNQIRRVFDAVDRGLAPAGPVIRGIAQQSQARVEEDVDAYVRVCLEHCGEMAPSEQCLKASQLAISIGYVSGLRPVDLRDLAMGCLISRAGMTPQAKMFAAKPAELTPIERIELQKNPLRTFDLIQNLPELSLGARQVAYQIFERFNGAGYPRRRGGMQIHPLARIASVADVYSALTSPRPHRPAYEPYEAILMMLEETRRGAFDPRAVRSLIQTVCLYPIGSRVLLTDRRVGLIIRSNHQYYDRPVVEAYHGAQAARRDDDREVIDLAEAPSLGILQVLPMASCAL